MLPQACSAPPKSIVCPAARLTYAFLVSLRRPAKRPKRFSLPVWLTTFTDATLTLNMNSTAALISGLVASGRTLNTYWLAAAARALDLKVPLVVRLVGTNMEQGKAILMVEQNVRKALSISDRAAVMELGALRLQDRAANLIRDERVVRLYMGQRTHS